MDIGAIVPNGPNVELEMLVVYGIESDQRRLSINVDLRHSFFQDKRSATALQKALQSVKSFKHVRACFGIAFLIGREPCPVETFS